MRELKAISLEDITLQIKDFSIEKLQDELDELGWNYTVTGNEDGKYDYCYIINNENGNKKAYIEYDSNSNSITNVIGYIDSVITSDDEVITVKHLIEQYGTKIQSGICNSPEIAVEDTIYPYVIDGKCMWCPFNITSECKDLKIDDVDTTLIKEFNIVVKKYLDYKIGIEIIKEKNL